MKRWLQRLFWPLVATIFVGLVVYGFVPKPVQVDTTRVERGSFAVTVDDDGETRIREKYVIAAPVAGKLLRIKLKAGDTVERNKTELMQIIPVDPNLLDARAQAEAEARVQAADASVDEAEALLLSAKENADLAQDQYDRALKLHRSASISPAEFEEAEHRHRIALAGLRSAEFRAKVKAHEREVTRTALHRFTEPVDVEKQSTMKILSPIDGRVLRVMYEDANAIAAGTPILELGDPQDIEVQIDVLSTDAVSIQPGSKVIIDRWGGDQPLHAVVRLVEPAAFLKISALGVEEKRVRVLADIVEEWEKRNNLGDGYRIEARIVVKETSEKALKIKSGTLFRHESQWSVYVVRNGQARMVPVDVGESNGLETEIKGGLQEGEIVILHPTESIRDGVAVKTST